MLAGARLIAANPVLRTPMLLGWLAAFYDVPEGVAAPLARMLGGGSATVGLLLASAALGAVLGSIAFSRLVGPRRGCAGRDRSQSWRARCSRRSISARICRSRC